MRLSARNTADVREPSLRAVFPPSASTSAAPQIRRRWKSYGPPNLCCTPYGLEWYSHTARFHRHPCAAVAPQNHVRFVRPECSWRSQTIGIRKNSKRFTWVATIRTQNTHNTAVTECCLYVVVLYQCDSVYYCSWVSLVHSVVVSIRVSNIPTPHGLRSDSD